MKSRGNFANITKITNPQFNSILKIKNQQKLCQIMKQLDKVEEKLFEGSESQCQRKSESVEDHQKIKNKSILIALTKV